MMLCPKCGKDNLPTSKFCQHCGASLAPPPPPPPPPKSPVCPKCGAENPPTGKFCDQCGTSLAPTPPPAPKSPVCPKCGKENLPTSKFCQQCGTSLSPVPPTIQSGGKQKPYSEPGRTVVIDERQKARLRRLTTMSNVLGISLGVVAVIVFFYFVIGPGSGQKGLTPVQTTTPSKTTPAATTPSKVSPPTSPIATTPSKTTPAATTPSKTSPPTSPITSTPPGTKTPITTTTPTGKTLSEILGLSANIVSIKYDMLVSGTGIPAMTQKIWIKKNRMRMEMTQQGVNSVTLIDKDAKTMYVYMPAQNLAMKMPFDMSQSPKSPTDEAKSIQDSDTKIIGTETVDGKVCSVAEYTSGQDRAKVWVWQDKGIPIRVEVTSSAGKTTVEYKNIDFADIPDSMFVLPAGVQIM